MSPADVAAHEAASYVRRPVARIPANASDDLLLRLHQETSRQTPAELRVTCPDHLNWRDRCAHLHEVAS